MSDHDNRQARGIAKLPDQFVHAAGAERIQTGGRLKGPDQNRAARPIDCRSPLENWRSESALFLLSRKDALAPPTPEQADLFG